MVVALPFIHNDSEQEMEGGKNTKGRKNREGSHLLIYFRGTAAARVVLDQRWELGKQSRSPKYLSHHRCFSRFY